MPLEAGLSQSTNLLLRLESAARIVAFVNTPQAEIRPTTTAASESKAALSVPSARHQETYTPDGSIKKHRSWGRLYFD